MKPFGVDVHSSTPELEQEARTLQEALKPWHVLPPDGRAELSVVLVPGHPAVVSGLASGQAVRQACRFLSMMTAWPCKRVLSGQEPNTLALYVAPGSLSAEAAARIAWGLFVWTAQRHTAHPALEQLYVPERPPAAELLPPAAAVNPRQPAVAYSATASQPLQRPGARLRTPVPPPAPALSAASPRRG